MQRFYEVHLNLFDRNVNSRCMSGEIVAFHISTSLLNEKMVSLNIHVVSKNKTRTAITTITS